MVSITVFGITVASPLQALASTQARRMEGYRGLLICLEQTAIRG